MRKIFTLLAAMVCSFASFAQDIQLETKDGQVIENGSTVTVKGEMEDMMIWGQFNSNLHVRNLTDKKQGVYATMKVIKGNSQICWGGSCVPVMEGNSHTTGMGVVDANSSSSLLIETLVMEAGYMDAIVSCTIEITVWTDKNPDQKVSATVTYTNDSSSGIEKNEVVSPVIYAKDNVLYCNAAANAQLQIYNVAGHLCKNIRLNSEAESLSLEGMTKGVYIYRVLGTGKPAVSGKFLVK
jgi:hypothetical protein